MPAENVTVRHCTDDGRWDYWLRCPVCGQHSAGRSSWWLALEAFAAGSNLEEWSYPDELREPHLGPPLNLLDLAELHLAMIEPDWIDSLARVPGSSERRPRNS